MDAQERKNSVLSHIDMTVEDLPDHKECASISEVLTRVGDKWSVLVVMMLRDRPRRFNELKRAVSGISQHMLAITLRGLERDGLVTRTQYPTIPPRVDYELTPLGHSLRAPVEALGRWAMANQQAMKAAQGAFDAKRADQAEPWRAPAHRGR